MLRCAVGGRHEAGGREAASSIIGCNEGGGGGIIGAALVSTASDCDAAMKLVRPVHK